MKKRILLAFAVSCLAVSCGDDNGGTGGTGGSCNNPLADTCLAELHEGCFQPDLSGTCTGTLTEISWSDGSKVVRTGEGAGFYNPGEDTPCVKFQYSADYKTVTFIKGQKEYVQKLQADGVTWEVTCFDGSTFTYTGEEGTASNQCTGVEETVSFFV